MAGGLVNVGLPVLLKLLDGAVMLEEVVFVSRFRPQV